MSRPLRIEYPGAIYHITSRGNAQSAIYMTDKDRKAFLIIFGKVCERYNWKCYAYCLMSNHYHLVIETVEANLSRGMRQLNGVYSQTFNRHHLRAGHLFQGRYKSILVEKDSYLLELIRYVLLNPVRACMTKTAGQYPWSSYRAMLGKVSVPDWLNKGWVLGQFGEREPSVRNRFIEFIRSGSNQPRFWDNLRYQIYLGEEQFIQTIQSRMEMDRDLSEIPGIQKRKAARPLSCYFKKFTYRNEAIITAYQSGNYTQKAIADYLGMHYSSVSRIVKKHEMMET